MLKYFGISLILVVATLAATFAINLDKPMGRIVGGSEAYIRNHAYQASLQLKSGEYSSHVCGCVIIQHNRVITAAHCKGPYRARDFEVRAGVSDLNDAKAVTVPVRFFIVHKNYNKNNFQNDVALIHLSKSLPSNNENIVPIPLARQNAPDGAWGSVTGWGDTSHRGHGSLKLLHAYVQIISNDRCNKAFSPYYPYGFITKDMVCAGRYGGGFCQGDSGGPLVYNKELLAAVSWSIGCASPDTPGVYASLIHFHEWIRLHL